MWYVCNRYTSFPSKIRFLASVLDVLFVHYVAYCYIRGCKIWQVTVACQIFDMLRRRESRLIVSTVVLLIANYPTTLYIPRGNLNVWLDFFQSSWMVIQETVATSQTTHTAHKTVLHAAKLSMPSYCTRQTRKWCIYSARTIYSDNINGYRMYIQDRTSVIVIGWRQSAASTMNGILK